MLFSRRLLPFALLNFPALAIEFWFEQIGRPSYTETANGKSFSEHAMLSMRKVSQSGCGMWSTGAGAAQYWQLCLAALLGSWALWLCAVVPLYSAWLAFSTYSGVRSGFSTMNAGAAGKGSDGTAAQSKRQAKLEKKGAQRMQYR
ncbi:hypothetical protein LTR22_026554 [Elasticomyces elasticus]|nr:hypothetical protein LTR22_026554 [Elasticomyces elasticus]